MNVIVLASRKGGSGKSTLAAHLAAFASKSTRSCLLIDADPQSSLTLWHRLRGTGEPPLRDGSRGLNEIIRTARRERYDWVIIDTPPSHSGVVQDAIRAATLVVIPSRPTIFDLTAVQDTIDLARQARKPYMVVINAAPAKREGEESPIVSKAREGLTGLKVPLWSGQITNRANFALSLAAGEGAREYDPESYAAAEISRFWSAVQKSVAVINGAYEGGRAPQRAAA
ncbi:MAG TPA: ParA family protein [Xanthobacteraceae bacterium]|nr:ParA family protein [Xanthobacteraceae bacterium]